jgi:hypothetical protein
MKTEGDIGKPAKALFNSFLQLSLLDQKFDEGAQMETEGNIKKPAKGLFNGFSRLLMVSTRKSQSQKPRKPIDSART